MIRILHPKIFVHLTTFKITFKQWKMTHKPKSVTKINYVMLKGFESILGRIVEHCVAEALIIQKAGFLRPCEVLNLTRQDMRLLGRIVFEGVGKRVAEVVIKNDKKAKNEKPRVALIEDEKAVKTLEVLIYSNRKMTKTANIFAQLDVRPL